jgi:hypothetical protein
MKLRISGLKISYYYRVSHQDGLSPQAGLRSEPILIN